MSAGRTGTERRREVARWPQLGFGAGLRAPHYPDVLAGAAGADFFEAISENYSETGGRPLAVLEQVRRDRPVALHGVSLSIASPDPLDAAYLDRLAALVARIEPAIVSDHLCFAGAGGRALFDLLPPPLTEATLEHVAERVRRVQDRLGRRLLLENPSTYLAWRMSAIPEPEFLAELARRADCGLLLDVNNVYVSSRNLGFDPRAYIDAIPAERVGQLHLAGFTDMGTYLFDTHAAPVSDAVWELYAYTLAHVGPVATLVEWDDDIPEWSRLAAEVERTRRVAAAASARNGEGAGTAAAAHRKEAAHVGLAG